MDWRGLIDTEHILYPRVIHMNIQNQTPKCILSDRFYTHLLPTTIHRATITSHKTAIAEIHSPEETGPFHSIHPCTHLEFLLA